MTSMSTTLEPEMQKPSNRRSVIKNSSSSAAAIFETCSNSTQQSISTQTSVYAPAFNPQSRMNSDDWYDSRNDSDTSVPHYGPPFVNRGFGIDLPTQQPVMPGLTRCNSGQLSESDSGQSFTSKSSLRNKSRNYNGSILRRSTGGYGSQSDVSSTHSIPISGNNLRPRTPPKRNDHGDAGVTYDAFSSTSSMYRETPKAIPFKKRNFNFDLENNSVASFTGALHDFGEMEQERSEMGEGLDTIASREISREESDSREFGAIGSMKSGSRQQQQQQFSSYGEHHHARTVQHAQIRGSKSMQGGGDQDGKIMVEDSFRSNSSITTLSATSRTNSTTTAALERALASTTLEKALRSKGQNFLLCLPRGMCQGDATAQPDGASSRAPSSGPVSSFSSTNSATSLPIDPATAAKFVVRPLWADVHRPPSFDSFTNLHNQEAQLLRQLISQGNCPHILFHGPRGSGRKTLIMALLREIFGPSAWKVVQEKRIYIGKSGDKVSTLVTSSPYHVEVEVGDLGDDPRTILPNLFKDITRTLETSGMIDNNGGNYGIDFRVLVLYKADKLSSDAQHIIRWLMDRYGDTCKLLLCCTNARNVVDSVKSRCQIIDVNPPSVEQIVGVLEQIAEKEDIQLSRSFALHIATDSNKNLRHAIESLEAASRGQTMREDLRIPTAWEDSVVEIANDIISQQTPKRIFMTRGKIENLINKNLPPVLLLQRLAQELLRKVDIQLKKEICHWHGFYEKRMPAGSNPNATYKLEEFVAKFMSIYKKHLKNQTS